MSRLDKTDLVGSFSGYILDIERSLLAYTPDAGYHGMDSFSYRINVGTMHSDPATIFIAVDDVPVALTQPVIASAFVEKPITLLATDLNGDALSYSIVTPPEHGSITGTPPNVTYKGNRSFYGSDSFSFKANDGMADSNIVQVSVVVNNDAPVLDRH